MRAAELAAWLDEYLDAGRFQDYAPNGLQVEGDRPLHRVVLGVTASLGLIEAAKARDADALLVHHGWFWRGEDARLTGIKGRRVRTLLQSGMSLISYHLPLDAHPEVGNNAGIALALGLEEEGRAGSLGLLCYGRMREPATVEAFARRCETVFGRAPLVLGVVPEDPVERIAWCSGAAQGEIAEAAALSCGIYLSGESSERTTHEARELGIAYFGCGHHATERFGVQALACVLAERFPEIEFVFVDEENPV